jgi:Txe/YoeB family toxin of Txe-Axe toxin-antitoxin module
MDAITYSVARANLAQDRRMLERINKSIAETACPPFGGTGTPEPLKDALEGF